RAFEPTGHKDSLFPKCLFTLSGLSFYFHFTHTSRHLNLTATIIANRLSSTHPSRRPPTPLLARFAPFRPQTHHHPTMDNHQFFDPELLVSATNDSLVFGGLELNDMDPG